MPIGLRDTVLVGRQIRAWEVGLQNASARLSDELHPITDAQNREPEFGRRGKERPVEGNLRIWDEIERDVVRQSSVAREIVAAG